MTILEVIEMKPRKSAGVIVLLGAMLSIAVITTTGTKSSGFGAGTLIRAKFRSRLNDPTAPDDRIRSDGLFAQYTQFSSPPQTCGNVDYVDKADTCTNLATPNAAQASGSTQLTGSLYFLRTIPLCCATSTNGWEQYVVQPSRWLVLDFSNPAAGFACPAIQIQGVLMKIDQQIQYDASHTNWGSLPPPTPPPATASGCVNNVDVRFQADQALNPNATSTSLNLVIDQPELQVSRTGGARIYWDGLYGLHFEQPVQIKRDPASGAVTLTTDGSSSDLADLLDANNNPVGTYHMPFSVTLNPAK